MNAHVAEMARRGRAGNESASVRKQLRLEASKHGRIPVIAALREHPVARQLETLPAERLLCLIPGITPPKADELLEQLPCKLTATVGDLTYRKRRLLIALLEDPGKPQIGADRRAKDRKRRVEARSESDRMGRRRMAGVE